MSDWEDYAQRNVLNDRAYAAEPVQTMRVEAMARRSMGTVLDVGGGDGFFAKRISNVTMVDISPIRVARAQALGVSAIVGDATDLPFDDNSYDTVVLGEVLEHLDDPGKAFAEAFRVSRGRVVISLPLNGWEDPTHEWRISLDDLAEPVQMSNERTKGHQIVMTWQRGRCWPPGYWQSDESWQEQFGD